MNRINEGMVYIFIGVIFLLITIDLIFPMVMFMMKCLFYILGVLSIIGGLMQIKDSKKN